VIGGVGGIGSVCSPGVGLIGGVGNIIGGVGLYNPGIGYAAPGAAFVCAQTDNFDE
jgi:hypothetical protein